MRKFQHFTWTQRLQLEALLKAKTRIIDIANMFGFTDSTIYREIKRGEYTRLNGATWEFEKSYSPEIAERKYRENLDAKGTALKIGKDFKFAEYIEQKIGKEHYTPLAVLGEIKANNIEFDTTICVNTLYNYIKDGVFLNISVKNLPILSKKKKTKHSKIQKRAPRGTSIEKRPSDIHNRIEFGHWEMDCVCGTGKACLLVLTERVTRQEIIFKISEQTSENVVKCLDKLEEKYGKLFSKVFKSITVDNGAEFSDVAGMEKSIYGDFKRTYLYYCHAYSAWERGSNERMNREIRRMIPKGSNISVYNEKDIKRIENWLNNYPRQVLKYRSSQKLFEEYLASA